MKPRFPVYVISKGRAQVCTTPRIFMRDETPFRLVVEPPEADAYRERFGEERVLVLPFHDLGQGSIPARNWCWEHALASGAERHWIVDDNIRYFVRAHRGERKRCDSGLVFGVIEEFTDRYENIGISGPDYTTWARGPAPPIRVNVHVYSCLLIDNALPYRWRGRYNEDTDLCLQVLAGGLCTVQFGAFLADKMGTMKMKGGNTDVLYQGDGRLAMARSLERAWPGIVRVGRRSGRPQHVVNWRRFTTPLKRRDDVDWDAIERRTWQLTLKDR